ncbi:MAG: hypothetical protein WD055_01850 [Candidatus Dependentiae bacterium]
MHHLKKRFILLCFFSACCASANQEISKQPLVHLNQTHDVDFAFFNDPYLFEQYAKQPLYDLTQLGISSDGIAPDAETPVVDLSETADVDFSFFNDPYAFETFRTDLPIKAKFSGYIQYASWWDSRQGESLGAGFIYFFPKDREFDADCRDVNAQGTSNMTTLETRVRAEFFGPEVLGAESFAYIEADFFGFDQISDLSRNSVINRMRLRNAFIQLSWSASKILLGQFYHPIFIIKTFPLNISIEAGAPIAPFGRNPQIRYTIFKNNYEILFAALTQLQFTDTGPEGFSSIYIRNSRMPMYIIRAAYDVKHIYAGAAVLFERLKPRIESNKGFSVNEYINNAQATAFATIKFEPLEIRQQITYAQNASNIAMLGGFAVSSVDPATDKRHYTNLNTLSYWMDININRKIEPGLFIGIAKNLGANSTIIQCLPNPKTDTPEETLYYFGKGINTLFKCSPRIRWHILPIDFATEIAYTRATYGCIDDYGRIQNSAPVSNTRLIFAAYYFF